MKRTKEIIEREIEQDKKMIKQLKDKRVLYVHSPCGAEIDKRIKSEDQIKEYIEELEFNIENAEVELEELDNTNVKKLRELYVLSDVRQRLGAENEDDDSFDDKINEMSSFDLVAAYCAWSLGDDYWWKKMHNMYQRLQKD